jgi:hypothetical protein
MPVLSKIENSFGRFNTSPSLVGAAERFCVNQEVRTAIPALQHLELVDQDQPPPVGSRIQRDNPQIVKRVKMPGSSESMLCAVPPREDRVKWVATLF